MDVVIKRTKNQKGAGNSNALTWTVITPSGELHTIKSLKSWCNENGYKYFTVFNSRKGFKAIKHGHGKGGPTKIRSENIISPKIIGHCKITDLDSNEMIVNKMNSVNFEALSYALALSLSDRPNGNIMQMVFGNGASNVSGVGTITYLPPNVTGLDATLYNQTYQKFVDDLSPLDTDTTNNFIRVNHTLGNTYSDVVVTCLLDYNEPDTQEAFDNAINTNGEFIFDEIGLKTYDVVSTTGYLLSHVIFHPVQKSLNRRIQIIYTLRIIMA
jgi:hypothetical protein